LTPLINLIKKLNMQIKGTCAIITGGASGIGKEVCKLLVQKG
jgi:NAD(P)-dependent dehydrogenase (short-subunit alcohol dehydrogenase family)